MDSADATIKIVFRGVRGSHPMPGPSTLRFGGNTTSQEIRAGGRLLILDAGTGVIGLGADLTRESDSWNIAIFFSHNHHDHIGGILYFKPAYNPATTMHIYGSADQPGSILDELEKVSSPAAHPVQLARMGMRYDCHPLHGGEVMVWRPGAEAPELLEPDAVAKPEDVVVRVMKNDLHPVEGVLNFRIEYGGKSYVYATDVEGDEEKGDAQLAEFARGADLLAHDGQYTSEEYFAGKRGWGHSTVRMAIRTAMLAGVRRLAIIHHDPGHDDEQLEKMEREGAREFPGLFFAHEGQIVDI